MRQKLEFIQEDLLNNSRPSEEKLRAFLDTNSGQYRSDHILSFKQVLIDSEGTFSADQIKNTVSELTNGTPPAELNRSSLLPVSMNLEAAKTISSTFGGDFLAQLLLIEVGYWHAPVNSAFGSHAVFVSMNQNSAPLDFESARHRVEIDYVQAQRKSVADNF